MQSDNIVGYQEVGVENGYTLATPTFYAVGGSAIDIQDILPTGANVPSGLDDGSAQLRFQLLNAQSGVTATYYWRDCKKTIKKVEYTFKGWYNSAAITKSDKPAELTIEPGTAFYMNCPVDGVSLRFSGEVKIADANIGLNNGYTLIGNPYPAAVQITALTPTGANVPSGLDDGSAQLRFQLLNAQSGVSATYYWRDCKKTIKKVEYTFKGWYNSAAITKSDVPATLTIPAGCGLYVNCPADEVVVNIKSPVSAD